jgi:hypothetical protein
MSRARLGFFVIGSVKAVVTNRNGAEGPSHWRRFVNSLNPKEENDQQAASSNRCSSALPICCPRHGKTSMLNVYKVSDFPGEKNWNQFCSLECKAILDRCGHVCNLACHSPVDIPHNTRCAVTLERPCEIHASIELLCYEVNIEKHESLNKALNRFECGIKVNYCRPECEHIVQIKCFEKKSLESNRSVLDDCSEIMSDYYHPICNHVLKKPKCAVKRRYEKNTPKCIEKVTHKRRCGCEIIMQCYESIKELANPIICQKSVEINRPRCGHKLSMRCFEAEKLTEDWTEKTGKSAVNRMLFMNEF